MKKLIYTAFVICGMLTASCSDLLNLESKTDVTNNYLFTTPEGLNTAVTGLYPWHVNCRVERIITNLICTSLPCVTLIRILPYLEQVFLPQSDV